MISTHILNLNVGQPAAGVLVQLEKKDGQAWQLLATEKTNSDGRISFQVPAQSGVYKLTFAIEKFSDFFQVAPVIFNITDTSRKYHIPLLLNSYGYSTYRGS